MNILVVTDLRKGFPMAQRARALRELGHRVTSVDVSPCSSDSTWRWLRRRGQYWLFRHGWRGQRLLEYRQENARLRALLRSDRWDVLWLDRALTIEAECLTEVKRLQPWCKIVGFCHDDAAARHNQSCQFLEQFPHYDVFFTTKSFNVRELLAMGCRRCEMVDNSYDPLTHRPLIATGAEEEVYRSDVAFVGVRERDRERAVRALCAQGVEVCVWGHSWRRLQGLHPKLRVHGYDAVGDEYAKVLSNAKISLCFLRRRNRDLQTTRSVEIPACGGFMLAERTHEHLRLFEEGVEAEYFSSVEELIRKTRHYLCNEEQRRRIALAGRRRCRESDYSNHARLKYILCRLKCAEPAALAGIVRTTQV